MIAVRVARRIPFRRAIQGRVKPPSVGTVYGIQAPHDRLGHRSFRNQSSSPNAVGFFVHMQREQGLQGVYRFLFL